MDDFTKSLGKQMNLVMKRMEETKKVRMRLREKQQDEEGERMLKKEIQKKEIMEKNNRKKAGLLMGKLHDDMMFLDKIANHPALQKNILNLKDEKAAPKDIDKVALGQ